MIKNKVLKIKIIFKIYLKLLKIVRISELIFIVQKIKE